MRINSTVSPSTTLGASASATASALRAIEKKFSGYPAQTTRYSGGVDTLIDSLSKLRTECAESNWDGEGADPVSNDALTHAFALLTQLPQQFPNPELAADPDSEISLDWFAHNSDRFSVSVGADGLLTYAGRVAGQAVNGHVRFEQKFPCELIDVLTVMFPFIYPNVRL